MLTSLKCQISRLGFEARNQDPTFGLSHFCLRKVFILMNDYFRNQDTTFALSRLTRYLFQIISKRGQFLPPTNESVGFLNYYLLSLIHGEKKVYLSIDNMFKEDSDSDVNLEIYSSKFMNNISCSDLLNHSLKLKISAPMMLIKNIDQSRGFYNGTRLLITRFDSHVLYYKILFGKHVVDMVFIPRMRLIPSNSNLPISFQRRHFPLVISFAMTINKSQG